MKTIEIRKAEKPFHIGSQFIPQGTVLKIRHTDWRGVKVTIETPEADWLVDKSLIWTNTFRVDNHENP